MTTAVDRCVYCEATSARRVACKSPKVEAWSCGACGGQWWFSLVSPQNYLDRLTGDVAAQEALREVTVLVEQAPGMSDEQLRARLLTLLITLDQHARDWPG